MSAMKQIESMLTSNFGGDSFPTNRWSDINILRFLSLYKTHSILWNPMHTFYGDQSSRMRAYAAIANRLNLHGITKNECKKLVESLIVLYARERERLTKECNPNYTSSPIWYHVLEEIVDRIKQNLEKPYREGPPSVDTESAQPRQICCSHLYTEDIWTPVHFKTNVTDWFSTLSHEQLLCTCTKSPGTISDDVSTTVTVSSSHEDSRGDSSCGILTCDDRWKRKPAENPGFYESCFSNNIRLCGYGKMESVSENTTLCPLAEAEQHSTDFGSSFSRKFEQLTTCDNGHLNKNFSKVDNVSATEHTRQICGKNLRLKKDSVDCHCGNEEISTSSECRAIASHSSPLLCACRSFSTEEKSDHRLDDQLDPTLCEKCAVDRDPIHQLHRNVINENPRASELDKYCRYKDWDTIYNIRTTVSDEVSMIAMNQASTKSLSIECKDENLQPRRENCLLLKADINRFTDPESSEAREVSLHNEYKREYGLNIRINQPRHYSCEVFDPLDLKGAQLML